MAKEAVLSSATSVDVGDEAPHDTVHARIEGSPLPWYMQTKLRELYLKMIILFLGSTTLGYDSSLLNGLQTMDSWQEFFHHPRSSRLGIFGAIPGFGGLFILFFAPYVADILGRRSAIAVGCLFVILGGLLQTFPPAHNPNAMYLTGRFIIGMGANLNNGACPLLITEVAHPRHRGRVTTIYNTLWYLGAILAAWISFGTLRNLSGNKEWRLPTGLQCLMPGIQLLLLWLLPESPRWLISKGRYDEARALLVKYHGNGIEDAFVQWEFAEIKSTLQAEQEVASRNGWFELVRTRGNRKRCLLIIATAIFSQCSGNGLVSYYLSSVLKTIGFTDSITQSEINGGLTIWCFIVSLGAAFIVDRVGRRVLFLFSGVGMLITFSIWTACSAIYAKTGSAATGSAVLAMIFLFYGVAGAAWPGLTVSYTVEILPYNIRAKGLMLCFCFTCLSGIFNLYVNPVGLDTLAWKWYFFYIAVLVVECLIIFFFFVETKGPTLEEIAVLFDGKDSATAAALVESHQQVSRTGATKQEGHE
ncbi:hexose transporter [Grosmannia clavigera kw1407]|uniref:Hexose transporter n=1 Tax=Grosmannia clavigera (strain kw1407 / UAMH 11150) TaxID=655863 RepID=F0XJV9_GROCL|nr:hexose transporter [Grosmannia clavigera kw1407]EFX02239.1 hexose transporter [Grosmannia clavigera kw1407]